MGIASTTPSITPPLIKQSLNDVENKRERVLYIQAMRAIAIFIVVATHCRDPFSSDTFIRSQGASVFFRHINIVFIFISGFLFQFLLKRFSYFGYLKTKIKNVIIPYVICSVPAIIAYSVGIKSPNNIGAPLWADSGAKLALYMLATGTHMAPFWFIPMMAFVYAVSPVLVRIDKMRFGYIAIAPLLLVSLLVGRSTDDSNPFQNFIFYIPVYMIGMAVSKYREKLMPFLSRYFAPLMLFIALPLIDMSADHWLDNFEYVTKIAVCLGLTGMFARFSGNLPKWVDQLGTISFGIYFVHYYMVAILTILSRSVMSGFFTRGLAAYVATVIIVLGVATACVMIVKLLAGRYSRMVIGA